MGALRCLTKPGPAGALDADGGSRELRLEGGERAELGVDGLGEVARGLAAAALLGRRQVRPEDAVVDVAAAVEAQRTLNNSKERVSG